MTLGTALLQPLNVDRVANDPAFSLAEDILRLFAIFAEDALSEGPMAAEALGAAEDVGNTITTWLTATDNGQTRHEKAVNRLNARFAPIRAFAQGLVEQTGNSDVDPESVIALIRQLLDLAKDASEAVTLDRIRSELQFVKSLLEDDLGFSPDFFADRIAEYIATLRARLAALPAAIDVQTRRRVGLARITLARLGLRTHLLVPPEFDLEPMARGLFKLFQNSGLPDVMRDINCGLDGVEATLNAAVLAGEAVATNPQPVGAGVVPLPDNAEYSYFASFIMRDEDLPLVGLADLSNAEIFATQFRDSENAVVTHIRNGMSTEERTVLDAFTTGEPDRDTLITLLSVVNRFIQQGPILGSANAPLIAEVDLPENIREIQSSYQDDQDLFLYNRHVIDTAFVGISDVSGGAGRAFTRLMANTFRWPHQQVFVTGDRKYIMCDDIPIHSGTDLKWHDAPIFAGHIRHGTWFSFAHASPEFCEHWAMIWTWIGNASKAIWHNIEIQPGHEAQNASVCAIEYADFLQQLLFGKPLSAHMLEGNGHLRRWGKSLDSFLGLKGIVTFASTFQSLQTNAPREKFAHWATMLGGDVFRTLGPISTVNTIQDILIEFVVLLNHNSDRSGPSQLRNDPPRNHTKQASFVALSDNLFAMLLVSLLPRDNYSIETLDPGRDDIGDQKINVFLVHMLAGGAGMGLAAGFSGSLVAQIIAWAEDFKRFFLTGAISAGKMIAFYLFYMYIFKENATDGGTYRAGGGQFRGYPNRETSPYLLPYPAGVARYCGQGNLGLFSHNRISNSSFDGGANAVQQVYAYDFDHDFGEVIACSRPGVVWSFVENRPDGAPAPWNFLTIMHTTIDPEHDDFGSGPVQTYSVYGHLALNGVSNAPAFGGVAPGQESVTVGTGTPVAQGDLIALAGDTGISFHNHLHMHVVPDNGSGPSNVFAIPFVFRDMRSGLLPRNSFLNDGNLKSTTWYRSRNG